MSIIPHAFQPGNRAAVAGDDFRAGGADYRGE
jgi:hypothetical protein